MKNMRTPILVMCMISTLLLLPSITGQYTEPTTIEIIDISGGFGGITVNVENTGDITANDLWVMTTISGGIFQKINILHECTGCSACSTTLAPGAIKSENSREAGLLFGFGPIAITTSAGASNADEVTTEATGLAIGPFVLVQ